MKVILLKDVAKIGRKYDVKDVASGFGLNFLIPQGSAKLATPEALKKIEVLKAEVDAERKIHEDLLAKNLHEVDEKQVVLKAKINDKGHLFAALHATDISAAIKESIGADISPEFIVLEHPIKEAGEHNIEVRASGKKATIKLLVEEK